MENGQYDKAVDLLAIGRKVGGLKLSIINVDIFQSSACRF